MARAFKISSHRYKGALLAVLNKRGRLLERHPLDTNREEYLRIRDEVVLPTCIAAVPEAYGYRTRIKQLMPHMFSNLDGSWSAVTELTYRLVAPPEHQTKENLNKIRILRATIEVMLSMLILLDDITDESPMREEKDTWHKVCAGGHWAAVYDGCVLGNLAYVILHMFFSSEPTYHKMLEILAQASLNTHVGQTLDVVEKDRDLSKFSPKEVDSLFKYKVGSIMSAEAALGLLHAGITDVELIRHMENIFMDIGKFLAVWDDFTDYYMSDTERGKPPNNIKNVGNSWLTLCALKHFNPEQTKQFLSLNEELKECSGHLAKSKMDSIKGLFDEIDMPLRYLEYFRTQYLDILPQIEALPDRRLRTACHSVINWFIADVCDQDYEELVKLK